MDVSVVIHEYSKYSPTYKGLTNHLPMVQFALSQMGKNESFIRQFSQQYVENNEIKIHSYTTYEIKKTNWTKFLGSEDYYESYFDYFIKEIYTYGWERVLKDSIMELLPGIGSIAFHGIIRLAYGVIGRNEKEIARGLAYFASSFQRSYSLGHIKKRLDFETNISKILVSEHFINKQFSSGSYTSKIREVIEDPYIEELIFVPDVTNHEKENIIEECIVQLYTKTNDFFLLHGVTGYHALKELAEWISDYNLALDYYIVALQVMLLAYAGLQFESPKEITINKDWGYLFEQAIKTNDVHTIKLVFSAYRLWHIRNDDYFYLMANFRLECMSKCCGIG